MHVAVCLLAASTAQVAAAAVLASRLLSRPNHPCILCIWEYSFYFPCLPLALLWDNRAIRTCCSGNVWLPLHTEGPIITPTGVDFSCSFMHLQIWRQLQQKDPAAFSQRADRGMSTLEALVAAFPLADPKVSSKACLHAKQHLPCMRHARCCGVTG